MKTLCILHTTPTTVASLKPLCDALLPGVAVRNLMDDSILPEVNAAGGITPPVEARVANLLRSAALIPADAVLFACSTIGALTRLSDGILSVPCLRIDRPMCQAAVAAGARIAVCATLRSTLEPTTALLRAIAAESDATISIDERLIDGANALLGEGRTDEYDAIVSQALRGAKQGNDVVVLAQASMARALARLDDAAGYLTSPESGLEAVRRALLGDGDAASATPRG